LPFIKGFAIVGEPGKDQALLGFQGVDGDTRTGEPTALTDERGDDSDILAARRVIKHDLRGAKIEGLGLGKNALRQRMADTVRVRVLYVFPQPVRAWMNGFAGKWVAGQEEAVFVLVELRVVGQKVARDRPKALVEPVEQSRALD